MPKRAMRGLMIDDTQKDLDLYCKYLNEGGSLDVEPAQYQGVDAGLAALLSKPYDFFLVDYELIKGKPRGDLRPALGSTLSAFLRERYEAAPILLVTRGRLFGSDAFSRATDLGEAFDEVLLKERIQAETGAVQKEIATLVAGFRSLTRQRSRGWKTLCEVLGTHHSESDKLWAAGPPQLETGGSTWRVSPAARWIRKVLLRHPGVLYDPLHASVMLGISEESFRKRAVQKHFRMAKYAGPFCPEDGRWWRGRLVPLAFPVLEKAELSPAQLHSFGDAWNRKHQSKLEPSVCVSSSESPAECVCYVLKEPVRRESSLPYQPDNRPHVMDEARVSFKAIRESDDFLEELIAPDSRCLVAGIQTEGGTE